MRASALDALQPGFAQFVLHQACAERDARPPQANLFDLPTKDAEVIDEAVAMRHLSALAPGCGQRALMRAAAGLGASGHACACAPN